MNLGNDRQSLWRTEWAPFPDVILHTAQSAVKKHPSYFRAKAGDTVAAETLVWDALDKDSLASIGRLCNGSPVSLLAIHALEAEGMNAIPRVFARIIGAQLNLPVTSGIIQSNRVSHTGASGYHRLAFPALFEGNGTAGSFLLVDDFVGQGGTLANLRGFIEVNGGNVLGATVLTGRADSAHLMLSNETLHELRSKHGDRLEEWWNITFGYGLDRLTESEARYLVRSDNVDIITERLTHARRGGN